MRYESMKDVFSWKPMSRSVGKGIELNKCALENPFKF